MNAESLPTPAQTWYRPRYWLIGPTCPRGVDTDRVHRFGTADRAGGEPLYGDRCHHCGESRYDVQEHDLLMWGDAWIMYDPTRDALTS